MGKANFKAASIAAACGSVLLATMPLAPGTAGAADLPIKAPPLVTTSPAGTPLAQAIFTASIST
jgi:hypothetical protein